MGNSELNTEVGLQRRKILGWLGLGVVGAMVIKILPVRITKKHVRAEHEKVLIKVNESAVKRCKKVSRNV